MKKFRNILYLLPLLSSASLGCTVIGSSSDEVKFASADHVLLARVMSASVMKVGKIGSEKDTGSIEAKYEVIETFKGNSEPQFARAEIFELYSCNSFDFSVGQLYLLFLSGPDRVADRLGGSHVVFLGDPELNDELSKLRVLAGKSRNGN
jgi:hypothetical protein